MNIVEEHYAKSSSYVDTLKEQINNGMYAHLFEGKHDLVFLDIGANIGLVSIYAVPFCKRIVAIEPSPEVFPVLKANTKDYLIIEAHQYALAPKDGECQFFLNDVNSTASSTVNTYGQLTTVRGLTLGSILQEHDLNHIDVAKFDCEGAEGLSLEQSSISDAKGIITTWYIEFHNCPLTSWEHKLGSAVANFSRCGYYKHRIDGMTLTVSR